MSSHAAPVALITGANRGLGKEIGRQLGQLGHVVLLGSRDADRGQAAAEELRAGGIDAHAIVLDVAEPGHIASAREKIGQEFGRLDVLVNNAGVHLDFGEELDLDRFRRTFEANVFGPFALTEALIPLLIASPAGRIVNHSSIIGSLSTVGGGVGKWATAAYPSSKAALNMLTVVWAQRLKDTPVKVNSAHPGWVKTELGTDEAPMSVEEGAQTAVWLATLPKDGPSGGFYHQQKAIPW